MTISDSEVLAAIEAHGSQRVMACVDCEATIPIVTCSKRCGECRKARALEKARAQYQKHKHKIAGRHKERYSDNPDKYRGYHYKHRYGLTREQVAEMHERQGRACKICRTPVPLTGESRTKLAVVDHCHATGRVRGLLCHPCNLLLGGAKDSPAVLLAAIEYLEAA